MNWWLKDASQILLEGLTWSIAKRKRGNVFNISLLVYKKEKFMDISLDIVEEVQATVECLCNSVTCP